MKRMNRSNRGETMTEVITAVCILSIVSGFLTMGFVSAFRVMKQGQNWRASLGRAAAVLEIGASTQEGAQISTYPGRVTFSGGENSAAYDLRKVTVGPTEDAPDLRELTLYEILVP